MSAFECHGEDGLSACPSVDGENPAKALFTHTGEERHAFKRHAKASLDMIYPTKITTTD